jgi:hypothetical protein
VRAATDGTGRIWVEVPVAFPRDAAAALARLGVTLHGPGTGPAVRPISQWAELLPLKPDPAAPLRGPVLIELPDAALPRLVADIRRLRPQPLGVRLLPDSRRAWLRIDNPPLFTVLNRPALDVFTERAPRAWVRVGWRHPLDGNLSIPAGAIALLRPEADWQLIADEPFQSEAEEYALQPPSHSLRPTPPETPALPVPLTLRPAPRGDAAESLWVLPGDPTARLVELAHATDEQLLRLYRIAAARGTGTARLVLRAVPGKAAPPPLLPGGRAYVAHEWLANLYLPVGYRLTPTVRPAMLAELLGLSTKDVAWLEPAEHGRFSVQRIDAAAFRPVADWIAYHAPARAALAPGWVSSDLFKTPRFVVEPDRAEARLPRAASHSPTAGRATEGWLGRLRERLFHKPADPRSTARRRSGTTPTADAEPGGRVGEKLASPQTLLLGNEWPARREALEYQVLTDLPRLPPEARPPVWAELAQVYAAIGQPADAAVCWLNAIWDRDPAPPEWVKNYLRTEARAARIGKDGSDPDAILRTPSAAQAARLAAAHLGWIATHPTPPAELVSRVPALLALLNAHEADVPARAVWLARCAAARLAGGDLLALARCRDRLFRRLAEKGPGLDVDAPSFLRFRGCAGSDRFQAARDWLGRVREPVHRWLARHAGPGRLQWAGLDPEIPCTIAYADLLLAWGLSRLGDRGRAKDWEAQAVATLSRATGTGMDPTVHGVLRAGFAERIHAAQDGRADRPGLPLAAAAELSRLDDVGRYAVDKLRAYSGVLEPVDRVNPYRGRDLGGFLGTGPRAERLDRLLTRPDLAPDPEPIRELLADLVANPTADTLPRTVFTLLELAPRLDPVTVARILPHTASAVELIPEWVRLSDSGDPTTTVKRFGTRMMLAAAHAAVRFHLPDALRRVADAVRAAATPEAPTVQVLEQVAGHFFRAMRRLGLRGAAAELLTMLTAGATAGSRELGLAVGWFVAGDEEAGNRILDAARDRLFVAGIADERDRTATAIAYAAALGHAPPRIALGRLEELFLRLDPVSGRGATNRYYTLKPLELIDTVVRAVVSDDFALGPGVRGWLDDDEYLIRRRITRDLEAAMKDVKS